MKTIYKNFADGTVALLLSFVFVIAVMLTVFTAQANAGGLAPPVITETPQPPAVAQNWTGAYAGIFGGRTTNETTYEEHVGYERQCTPGQGKWGGKCTVNPDDHANSPELVALGPVLDGHPSNADSLDSPFRYNAGYTGVWVTEPLTYTSQSDEVISSRYAQNEVIGKVFETMVDSEKTATYGVFAGYRYDMGLMVPGVEASYDVESEDFIFSGQLGLDAGNALFFASYNSEEVPMVGVDMMASESVMIGLTAGEDTVAFRAAYRF